MILRMETGPREKIPTPHNTPTIEICRAGFLHRFENQNKRPQYIVFFSFYSDFLLCFSHKQCFQAEAEQKIFFQFSTYYVRLYDEIIIEKE